MVQAGMPELVDEVHRHTLTITIRLKREERFSPDDPTSREWVYRPVEVVIGGTLPREVAETLQHALRNDAIWLADKLGEPDRWEPVTQG